MLLVFAISTQLAFGQGNGNGNGPVATPEDLFNYAMLKRVAVMEQISQKAEAAHPNFKARGFAKQQTGLNDAQQAILVRYAQQFDAANTAMFAARTAALNANNAAAASQAERAFHTASKASIEALKKELGPDGWGTLMSTFKKNNFSPIITDISHSKKGGN